MALASGITIGEFEVVDGELVEVCAKTAYHNLLRDLLIRLLRDRPAILSGEQMFESKLIPGFAIGLADLFDRV